MDKESVLKAFQNGTSLITHQEALVSRISSDEFTVRPVQGGPRSDAHTSRVRLVGVVEITMTKLEVVIKGS